MATYAIGDVQGCADSLAALVHRLPFRPQRDRLWFVGDLVNRGPKSAEVLRMIRAAGPSAQAVLGNHDFHLLAMASGARPVQASDTVSALLQEPDADDLIDWLRHQPLCVADGKTLMVHARIGAADRPSASRKRSPNGYVQVNGSPSCSPSMATAKAVGARAYEVPHDTK
ncbi:MAG: metallophosphoesterase [Burkholderiaceae bacterium]